ncbi:septum formation initiator [Micromonospora echinofusca]|uniref:Septum formation initiator n=1 Tax=Micromonospora echinofusca TaxID=47858 RepID=A0ABS3VVU7_MICEH|nr:septum formation initiator [Micromonospora echinofusca]MBO4208659.1 septum formation initiator [Micromonospora echinofusca]
MGRRTLLAVLGWLAAAVLATGIGLGAIRLVGESITGTPGGVRDAAEVERALAGSPEPTPEPGAPSAGPTDPPGGSGTRRSFVVRGGSVVAECAGREVRLVSWAPAPGYRVKEADRGPDDDVEVTFDGPGGRSEVRIVCSGGVPVVGADD